ncbi:hypothetical protein L596_012003 [Steinernema carpocapsae]|uniref:Uncharacterized protein n=1 Tax=Steinernema carpocapsae TaxID=34508 RepID=A0A4U5NWM4_STECR|nr:hypothetical protein L596_012003 [Steinernema carpocapsae]
MERSAQLQAKHAVSPSVPWRLLHIKLRCKRKDSGMGCGVTNDAGAKYLCAYLADGTSFTGLTLKSHYEMRHFAFSEAISKRTPILSRIISSASQAFPSSLHSWLATIYENLKCRVSNAASSVKRSPHTRRNSSSPKLI